MSAEHRPERLILSVLDAEGGATSSTWYVCVACTPDRVIQPGQHIAQWPCAHARELPDDADAKRQTLAELVAYRLTIIGEITTMLRATPRYDRDYPALLRAARRIEEWASP